jgi:hypothetical protein
MGPRAGLDAVAKIKDLFPCQESNPGRPASNRVTVLPELSRLHSFLVAVLIRIAMIVNAAAVKSHHCYGSHSH